MKFGIREICNVVLKAKKTGKILGQEISHIGQPVLRFETLKTSALEGTGEMVYARGGRGNSKLVAWEGDKEVTFVMEDAVLTEESLALLVGASEVNKTAPTKKHIAEEVAILSTGDVSFTYQPVSTDEVWYCDPSDPHNGKQGGVPDGYTKDTIFVDYYTNIATGGVGVFKASGLSTIDVTPESFGSNFYLEAETLFRDEKGVDHAAEFIIPNCRVQSNFNFTMASSGDPSTFTFTMDVFPDKIIGGSKKVLCAIQIADEEENIATASVEDDEEE